MWVVKGVSDAAVLDARRPIPHHPSSLDLFVCAKSKGAHKVKPASKPRLYFYIQ